MQLTDELRESFYRGELLDAYKYFGCIYCRETGNATFRVFAPRAESVSVIGEFNKWDASKHIMNETGGVFSITVKGIKEFDAYKYLIKTRDGRTLFKADPYAFHAETNGGTNSKVYDIDKFKWTDSAYIKSLKPLYDRPMNIYEVHIASWRKHKDHNYFTYRHFADEIVGYLKEMQYTHIELIGIAEHPFGGSWGYQVTGYFAPTSRHGTPEDFAYMVNKLHQNGIGVIFDWVPSHFPKDASGLYEFDGSPLYEPEDHLRQEHIEWGTRCFDYGRGEVKSFLISNALYWMEKYHIDGLRVDAVASMLYNNYNRKEFRPNRYGGAENLEAVDFFQKLNTAVFSKYPNALMIAEESTSWPNVTKPAEWGGLGFNFKWNMGWMNDALLYAKTDPIYRGNIHEKLTFSLHYSFSENFVLPISHDEVVYGKCSLLNKMPGDIWQKLAGWRNFLMYMYAHPGKKLTMMGTEFAQFSEWYDPKELDWMLLDTPQHHDAKEFTKALNTVYRKHSPFWEVEGDWSGFEWRVVDDRNQNVFVFERRDKKHNRILCILNFSNCDWNDYRFGVYEGEYKTLLYSDVGGFNAEPKVYKSEKIFSHGDEHSIMLNIPALSGMYLQRVEKSRPKAKIAEKTPAKPTQKKKTTKKTVKN